MRQRIRNRKTMHPWEDWVSRRGKFTLVRGRDFPKNVAPYSMAQQIRNYVGAWEIGHAEIDVEGDKLVVEIHREEREMCHK